MKWTATVSVKPDQMSGEQKRYALGQISSETVVDLLFQLGFFIWKNTREESQNVRVAPQHIRVEINRES